MHSGGASNLHSLTRPPLLGGERSIFSRKIPIVPIDKVLGFFWLIFVTQPVARARSVTTLGDILARELRVFIVDLGHNSQSPELRNGRRPGRPPSSRMEMFRPQLGSIKMNKDLIRDE